MAVVEHGELGARLVDRQVRHVLLAAHQQLPVLHHAPRSDPGHAHTHQRKERSRQFEGLSVLKIVAKINRRPMPQKKEIKKRPSQSANCAAVATTRIGYLGRKIDARPQIGWPPLLIGPPPSSSSSCATKSTSSRCASTSIYSAVRCGRNRKFAGTSHPMLTTRPPRSLGERSEMRASPTCRVTPVLVPPVSTQAPARCQIIKSVLFATVLRSSNRVLFPVKGPPIKPGPDRTIERLVTWTMDDGPGKRAFQILD